MVLDQNIEGNDGNEWIVNTNNTKTTNKRQKFSNATNVTIKPLGRTIWKHICGNTVGKSQTNATNVTMQPLGHVI